MRLPIPPERWPQLRRLAADPLVAAVLWTAAASFAEAGVRDESGRIDPAARRWLRAGQAFLALLGASAWLRTGFRGVRLYGLTMAEASVAGGVAGALGAVFALLVRIVGQLVASGPRPNAVGRALALTFAAPFVAFLGYVAGAALAAMGAFLERFSPAR